MEKKEISWGGNLEKQKFVKRGFWKNERRENWQLGNWEKENYVR